MDLKDFIITNARVAGLGDDDIAGIFQSVARKFPGNVPKERWEEQVMIWINNRAKRNQKGETKECNESIEK